MKLVKGNELSYQQQQEVLRLFTNRHTGENKPAWAICPPINGCQAYPIQFADDKEWLTNTEFCVSEKTGRLDRRVKRCISHPTWPHGIAKKVEELKK